MRTLGWGRKLRDPATNVVNWLHHMTGPIIIAVVTMVCTDILGTIMVMAEARNRGWLAGWMDTAQYLVGIVCTTIMVTILQNHSTSEKVIALVALSAANLFGTKLGQMIGHRFVTDKTTLADRVAALERTAQVKGHN